MFCSLWWSICTFFCKSTFDAVSAGEPLEPDSEPPVDQKLLFLRKLAGVGRPLQLVVNILSSLE